MMVLGYAWRSLLRTPGFALAATATFALGIGVNAAVFASVDRLLFRPLPFRDSDRLFLLQQTDVDSGQRLPLPARYLVEARDQLGLIEDAAFLGDSSAYFATPAGDGPEIRISRVTSRMLEVSGVRPAIGRGFLEDDDRLDRQVVVLTHEGWLARFGGDPDVLGRRIWFRDNSLEIIGVLPPGFIVPGAFIDPNIVGIGRMATPTQTVDAVLRIQPPTVRLRPGVTREAAQAAMDVLVERLKPEMPRPKGGAEVVEFVPIRRAMFGQYFPYLWLAFGGASLVLGIACANLAGLFLVRGRARLRDTAVRLSLGASRRRLLADALAEGLVVCLLGATAALLTLHWSTQALGALLPPIFSRFSAGVDGRVVLFALGAAGLASLAASILPALLLRRDDLWRVIQGGRSPRAAGAARHGRWLLAAEAAVGVVLIAGAAVTARNLTRLTAIDLGFDPTNVNLVLVTSTAATPAERYVEFERALAIVRMEPGVVSAAGAPAIPVLRTGAFPFSKTGPPCCRWQVTGDYVATIGVPLLAGRAISDADVQSLAPVAMLNDAGLKRVWPGVPAAAAVGRLLTLDTEPAREVVGIIGDTRRGYDDDLLPAIYVPVAHDLPRSALILARMQPGVPLLYSALRTRIENDPAVAQLRATPAAFVRPFPGVAALSGRPVRHVRRRRPHRRHGRPVRRRKLRSADTTPRGRRASGAGRVRTGDVAPGSDGRRQTRGPGRHGRPWRRAVGWAVPAVVSLSLQRARSRVAGVGGRRAAVRSRDWPRRSRRGARRTSTPPTNSARRRPRQRARCVVPGQSWRRTPGERQRARGTHRREPCRLPPSAVRPRSRWQTTPTRWPCTRRASRAAPAAGSRARRRNRPATAPPRAESGPNQDPAAAPCDRTPRASPGASPARGTR